MQRVEKAKKRQLLKRSWHGQRKEVFSYSPTGNRKRKLSFSNDTRTVRKKNCNTPDKQIGKFFFTLFQRMTKELKLNSQTKKDQQQLLKA